jgi:hypothetical protein
MSQINGFCPMPHHHGGQALGQIIEGMVMKMAEGILASFFNPLGAGPNAFGQMPSLFGVRCGTTPQNYQGGNCWLPQPKMEWTAQMTGTNTAKVDLGDGYRLEIDERNSEMTVFNDKTGERTRIWGDPHVEIDGKQAFDFWGTTSFTLANGTKITINTEQWKGNPNAYVASQVVVTKGSNALVIDGISQNKLGDLSMSLSNKGYQIDAAHRDGFQLHENKSGSGWRTESGNIATQNDLNATAIGREYGPGSEMPSLSEFGDQLGAFLLFGAIFSMANWMSDRVYFTNEGQGQRNDDRVERSPRDFFRHTMIP